MRDNVIELALDEPALSPRELAVRFTDSQSYFVSEASVYRLLKARDLIASPAFIVIKAADAFKDKTTAPNQLWQTDFTYLKVIGWGWFYLSTVLDDFSRYIVAWKLCTSMRVEDVTATLDLALRVSGLDQTKPTDRPRLLSDNGSSYIAGDLAKWLNDRHITGCSLCVRRAEAPPEVCVTLRWREPDSNFESRLRKSGVPTRVTASQSADAHGSFPRRLCRP